MKTIRIAFRDFWAGFEPDHFFQRHPSLLRHWRYEISDRPDLVVYSSFPGGEKLMRCHAVDDDAVRLYYTAENVPPDLAQTDFAIGFDRDLDDERYLRLPNYVAAQAQMGYAPDALADRAERDLGEALELKQAACVFVQGNSVPWRNAFVERLAEVMRVDCAGPVLNNTGFTISRQDKYSLYRRYKFAVTFENERSRGYVTEKLNDALLTDVVPIYAGDPSVEEDFDPGCFLNLDRFESESALIDEVVRLDRDDAAYAELLRAPAYAGDRLSTWADPEHQLEFFDRVMTAAAAGRRWFWMGSHADGSRDAEGHSLTLGPGVRRESATYQISSDPLDQPDVVADEVRLEPLATGSVRRLRIPSLLLQWDPREAVDALERWRSLLTADGRLELAVGDWEACRRLADWAPAEAFAELFAHGSRRAPRWGWTATELREALVSAGFAALDVRPFGRGLRARAAADPALLEDPHPAPDLVLAWPRFDRRELRPVIEAFAAGPDCGLRLALRYDAALDGPLDACLERLQSAAADVAPGPPLNIVVLTEATDDLCPFELAARTALVVAAEDLQADRRRFLDALGREPVAPGALTAALEQLDTRRSAG